MCKSLAIFLHVKLNMALMVPKGDGISLAKVLSGTKQYLIGTIYSLAVSNTCPQLDDLNKGVGRLKQVFF